MPPFKENVDAAAVERLAAVLGSGVDGEAFVAEAVAGLDGLELKARVAQVARALGSQLPADFLVDAAAVERTVPPSDLGMWEVWPVTDWVAAAGIDHPEMALALLARLTSGGPAVGGGGWCARRRRRAPRAAHAGEGGRARRPRVGRRRCGRRRAGRGIRRLDPGGVADFELVLPLVSQ